MKKATARKVIHHTRPIRARKGIHLKTDTDPVEPDTQPEPDEPEEEESERTTKEKKGPMPTEKATAIAEKTSAKPEPVSPGTLQITVMEEHGTQVSKVDVPAGETSEEYVDTIKSEGGVWIKPADPNLHDRYIPWHAIKEITFLKAS